MRIASTIPDILPALRAAFPKASCEHVEFTPATLTAFDLLFLDEESAACVDPSSAEERPTIVVLTKEGNKVPTAFVQGLADDLLVLPVRMLDLYRVEQSHDFLQTLRRLEHSTQALPVLVRQLEDDIRLAEKIQRRLIREKFPAIGGLSIKSKYWCGLKSGGDYFDVFEFPDASKVGIVLADSSSYSLSTNFIGSMMQFAVHMSKSDPAELVRALYGKLREGMKEKDRMSIFYGVLDRKTYRLSYVHCGAIFGLQCKEDGQMDWLARGESDALGPTSGTVGEVQEVALEPGGRLVLASDGWAEATAIPMGDWMTRFAALEAQELLNQMAFGLRKAVEKHLGVESSAEEEFPMPPQDCSVLVFDLAKNVLRLASN